AGRHWCRVAGIASPLCFCRSRDHRREGSRVRRAGRRVAPNLTRQCRSTPLEALSFFSAVLLRLSLLPFVLLEPLRSVLYSRLILRLSVQAPAERHWYPSLSESYPTRQKEKHNLH